MLREAQITGMLAFVGDRSKRQHDLTFSELHLGVCKVFPCSERSFRRMIAGLKINSNDRGYYTHADAVVIFGWFKLRDRFNSYAKYMTVCGKALYEHAENVDFSQFGVTENAN